MSKIILEEEYAKLGGEITSKNRVNIINNIIEIKLISETHNYIRDISKDFKYLFKELSILSDTAASGYDHIDFEKIKSQLSNISFEKQIVLLNYFSRKLKNEGLDNEVVLVQNIIYKSKVKEYSSNICNLKNIGSLITLFPTHSIKNVVLTLLILFSLFCLITSPIVLNLTNLFEFTYHKYSEYVFINHLVNSLAFTFGVNENIELTPVGIPGTITSIIVKILFFIFVVNILLNKLTELFEK